ncbi:MAG: ComF family protein [Nitrospiraceae bacterium]|nr:ComF family protein [Nitrospiraceae bacterium]
MFDKMFNLFFPSKCPVCEADSDNRATNPICSSCWVQIKKFNGPRCQICGLPVVSEFASLCAACIEERPHFEKIHYYASYTGVIKEAIHLMKFSGIRRLAKPLAKLLGDIQLSVCDVVIPVPLHRTKLIAREFNQTAALAKHISKNTGARLLTSALIKTKLTQPQTSLSGVDRRKNLKKAFAVCEDISGLKILLVDDVITTGATVAECARVLKKAGAAEVHVAALARSLPKH